MKGLKYVLILLVFISLISSVEAVGIAGNDLKRTVFFVPGETFTYEYYAVFTRNNQEVALLSQGSFGDYVSFSPDTLTGNKGDYVPFTASITLPSNAEPGEHSSKICVVEDPDGGSGIVTRTKSCAIVTFLRLYYGKYLDAGFSVSNANVGDDVELSITARNLGEEDIDSVSGTVKIYEGDTIIETLDTNSISLDSTEQGVIKAYWDSEGYNEGNYFAKATVNYDSHTKNAGNKSFQLGNLNLFIDDYTKTLEKDKINEFEIEVRSGWNSPISSVYGSVNILKDDKIIDSFKTAPESLDPWKSAKLIGYFDASDLELGEYDADITVNYEKQKTSVSGKIEIVEPYEEPKPVGFNSSMIIAAAIIIAIFIIIISIRKKHEKKR